jgi:hypothetical protein
MVDQLKIKKAVFGSLIKQMLGSKDIAAPDGSEQYRQTFNVKDSETGEKLEILCKTSKLIQVRTQ